ncbi:MAG: hypothetical protein FJ297_10055 [Planctomycetes bacterium]|nr:hypothetical protein [Planctomycetota bacterium]
MNYALIGVDDATLRWVDATTRTGCGRCRVAYDVPPAFAEPLRDRVGPIPQRDDWEALLHESLVECVVFAAEPDERPAVERRADQWRKLAATRLPLLAVQPACESMVAFEIDMIRGDGDASLGIVHDDLNERAIGRLRAWLAPSASRDPNEARHVVIERRIDERTPSGVRRQLARDMLLVRWLLGDASRVNALGGALTGGSFQLSAQIESHAGVLVRWSMASETSENRVRIEAAGPAGSLVVAQRAIDRPWTVHERALGATEPPQVAVDAADFLSVEGESLVSGRVARDSVSETGPIARILLRPNATWLDGARATEVAEAIERSVRRARTVDILNERHSEEGTFKGVMAMGSCLLLTVALVMLVVGAIVEGLRYPSEFARWRERQRAETLSRGFDGTVEPGEAESSRVPLWLRLWPVYPLGLFLGLQLLRIVAIQPGSTQRIDAARRTGSECEDRNSPPAGEAGSDGVSDRGGINTG